MLRRLATAALAAAAVYLLLIAAAFGQEFALYYCRPPVSGSPVVLYRWYTCWPDSNTTVYFKQSRWPMIGVAPDHVGQWMRVQAIDAQGRAGPMSVASPPWSPRSRTSVGDLAPELTPRLLPSYPNPFNPSTTIVVSLPEATRVHLAIYDTAGRLVRSLSNETLPGGVSRIPWDGRDDAGRAVASGSYLCRLGADAVVETQRLMLVR
jgi:hypothetical protein